jgi:hypothetical protein
MGRSKWKGAFSGFLRDNFLTLLLFLAVVLVLLYGLSSAAQSSAREGRRIVEESVRRAVVSCYAIEGVYPESLDYLREHYNLHIDQNKYYVRYEVFASNVMPEVTVIEVGA